MVVKVPIELVVKVPIELELIDAQLVATGASFSDISLFPKLPHVYIQFQGT